MADAPDRSPVTVGELIDTLSTYPRDALVFTAENGGGGGSLSAEHEGVHYDVWTGCTSAGNWYRPEKVPFEKLRPKRLEAK